jgi:hypothetical protein
MEGAMPIIMRMRWEGVTPQQYDEVRRQVDWVSNPADGGNVHLASFAKDGALHCYDAWDSEKDLNNFLEKRLMPAVMAAGITTQPTVEIDEAHEVFVVRTGTITIPEQNRVLAATPL